jgi:hypothetical protein
VTTFADTIRKHGFRNTGYDLLGFQYDMEAELEDSDLFEWVDVKPTGNDDCMLAARCKLKADVPIARAKEDLCAIWEGSLRYSGFADHSFEDTRCGFVFHFVTGAPRLGVVGRIECLQQ